jgi:trk system potassium uptake protein TrkA
VKIVIIGAGFTGSLLAKALVAERNNVVLIDNDPDRVRSAGDQLDCTVIEADGNNLKTLEKSGIANADALVTLTGDDELNMIICSIVDAIYPDILKIARVRDYDRYMRTIDVVRRSRAIERKQDRPTLGINHIVNPDVEAASSIMRAMEIGAAGTAIEIGGGFAIVELPVAEGCPIAGKQLRELSSLEGWSNLVAFVEADGETILPNGDTIIAAGNHVGILAQKDDISKILEFTGTPSVNIESIAIFGADNISALTVAAQMNKSQTFWYSLLSFGRSKNRNLLVIDRDIKRCRALTEKFPEARILNGDITDDELLQGEGICDCDLMIAASGNFERNLMTAAYMKLRGVGKVIALTSDSAFDEIAAKLGVDVTVPMRDVVIDTIMSHLRGRNVKEVHSIGERKFEIVSCEISEDSAVVGKSLKDIGGLDGALMLLVKEPDTEKCFIPTGETVMFSGAQIVLIMPAADTELIRKFAGKPEIVA